MKNSLNPYEKLKVSRLGGISDERHHLLTGAANDSYKS